MRKRVIAAVAFVVAACMMAALCACTESYEPKLKSATLESSALIEAGTLRVGVNAASYPFAGQSKGGINGLDVDVAAAVADELGLSLELVDVGMDGAAALAGGDVDMAMGIDPEDVSEKDVWTSAAYAPSCIAMFSSEEGAKLPKKSANPVIAAQTSSLSAYLVSRQYGASALKADDELKAVFQDLQDGGVKYVAADAVVGSYVVNNLGMEAHIIGLMQKEGAYTIAVSKSNTELQLGVTQALSAIEGNGVLNVIMTKWAGGPIDVSKASLTSAAKAEAKEAASSEKAKKDESPSEGEAEEANLDGALSDDAASDAPEVGANAVTIE